MEVLEKNEDASLQDAIKAAGIAPQKAGEAFAAAHQILSQGWKCPKKGKLLGGERMSHFQLPKIMK